MIAQVLLPIPGAGGFDYLVPLGMEVHPGQWVRVPFGKRTVLGIVRTVKATSEYQGRLLPLLGVEGEVLPEPFFPPLEAIFAESAVAPGLALSRLLPKPARSRVRHWVLTMPPAQALSLAEDLEGHAPREAQVLRALALGTASPPKGSTAVFRRLLERGLVQQTPLPFTFSYSEVPRKVIPTGEQEEAIAAITRSLGEGKTFLLFGPPASGKTEVYLSGARASLAQGGGALLLAPEVSLLPQLWARARLSLGQAPALYFGELPAGERWRVWQEALAGRARAVVGTRSAVFLPLSRLGLIVLDEEGEPAYKEEMAPHYHARRVAEARASWEKATVVLGSAAPSVETFFRAQQGEITLLPLTQRLAGTPPEVSTAPKEEEAIGPRLREAMARHLAAGGQILLFINRLGFFTGAACRRCENILRCPDCEVPLAFHLPERLFRCPACGRGSPEPSCPKCDSTRFRLFGTGTERVEHEAKAISPTARVARLDAETASERDQILAALARGEIQILVGAQMVGKGLDFPGITLVGIIDADQMLASPTFYAAERTFQLLTAAIGRAGRGEKPGEVVVQTNMPEHYAIAKALRADYLGFFQEELRFRELLRYPPFSRLVRIRTTGRKAEEVALKLVDTLREHGLEALGPARLHPLRNKPRWQILVRGGENLPLQVREALPSLPPGVGVEPDPLWLG